MPPCHKCQNGVFAYLKFCNAAFLFKGLFLHSKTGLGSEEVLQTYLEIWSLSGGLLKAYYVDQLTLK